MLGDIFACWVVRSSGRCFGGVGSTMHSVLFLGRQSVLEDR